MRDTTPIHAPPASEAPLRTPGYAFALPIALALATALFIAACGPGGGGASGPPAGNETTVGPEVTTAPMETDGGIGY